MVKLSDIVDAMDLTSEMIRAFLHRPTGEVVMLSADTISTAQEEDDFSGYLDWEQQDLETAKQVLETNDYLELPDQFEIDEYSIMESFCCTLNDRLSADMLNQIRGSGAFRRFKNAIHRYDVADDWYQYKQASLEKIAADWLEMEGVAYEGAGSNTQSAAEVEDSTKMTFEGTWHISEMEMWDEDYFNMEVQAYVTVNNRGTGDFQFGLVSGQIDGEIVKDGKTERFEFTWEGNDECDEASGAGWLRLKTADELEGRIKLHGGDSSMFAARRA
ncbi:MAG: UPF0158 family protein [Leptolyngbyaceae cyanobacterium MO_188.B28]|nr:UPF0158 family protein [Leptolyngbyaceae cyanobacterium MO_188.B28]